MEFRLTYEGLLLGASRSNTRAQHKQDIRQKFHPQLKAFWDKHPFLNSLKHNEHLSGKENRTIGYEMGLKGIEKWERGPPWLERHANSFERMGFRFAPLITEGMDMMCSLDILFLRPGSPGGLVNSGDIDNRLKTLFDALRMPVSQDELGGATPSDEFNPFFVLLEDDRLITRVSVETDLLLTPKLNSPNGNECQLIIKVNAHPYSPVSYSEKMDRYFWS